ncbi:DUF4138 domain-containing protein [Flexithrix dorotheae]|uniref:DUF4138 domain-containing protein n=1 Tax=Flexithrix dorotheae TaxID=70993 RepID=UPI0003730E26|nr:DUF4138 domain-containing protein [Flexithrix dorotheae]
MKRIVLLLLLTSGISASHGQVLKDENQHKNIVISAFKVIYVKIPATYKIEDIQLGMEEQYFSAKIVKDNLFAVQANTNQELPPSNISIICENVLFQANIIVEHSTTQYFYEFKEQEAIYFGSPNPPIKKTSEMETNQPNVVLPPNIENNNKKTNLNLPVAKNEFEKDRCVLGGMTGKIGFYVNNIVAIEEDIYLSFKMKNYSNLTYYCEYLQFFLIAKSKKQMASVAPEKEILTFERFAFPSEIKPGSINLFIVKFNESFSLSKGNYLQVIMDEGEKGRRIIEHIISEKEFFKNISTLQ